MNDLVSDMITRIRNAGTRRYISVMVINTKYCQSILDCLTEEGFIRGYTIQGKELKVHIKYYGDKDHPVSKGYTCIKGREMLKYQYNSKRIKFPLKRENHPFVFSAIREKIPPNIAKNHFAISGSSVILSKPGSICLCSPPRPSHGNCTE